MTTLRQLFEQKLGAGRAGGFTQPEVVATRPEKDTQVTAPQAVVAYFGEDVSTVGATFTLRGEEPVDGSLAY